MAAANSEGEEGKFYAWTPDQVIDHRVGFDRLRPIGTWIDKGEEIGRVHARTLDEALTGVMRLRSLYTLGETAPEPESLIVSRISE